MSSAATLPATQNGNGHAPAPPRPPRFITKLEMAIPKILAALPKHLTAERLVQVVSLVHYRTPKLQECDPDTILSSVVQGAALGLDFSPSLGEAYLVPVWNKELKGLECQLRPGYQGLIKLARNTGKVDYVQARAVHEADGFHYRYTPDLDFLHEPFRGANRGRVTDYYAVAKLATGDFMLDIMTVDDIELIHQRSESYKWAQSKDKPEWGPWVTDRAEMEKKTVIRRLCKVLPKSADLAKALEYDDRDYDFSDERPTQVAIPRSTNRGISGVRSGLGLEHQPSMAPTVPKEADTPPEVNIGLDWAHQPAQTAPAPSSTHQQEAKTDAPRHQAPAAQGQPETWESWSRQLIEPTNVAWRKELEAEGIEDVKPLINSHELVNLVTSAAIEAASDPQSKEKLKAEVSKDGKPGVRDAQKAARFVAGYFKSFPDWVKETVAARLEGKRQDLRASLGMFDPNQDDGVAGGDGP